MPFIFRKTPLEVIQHWMEDDRVWIAVNAWVKTREAVEHMSALDAMSMTQYKIFSPEYEKPIGLLWVINSEYGYRMATLNEDLYLENYLNAQV